MVQNSSQFQSLLLPILIIIVIGIVAIAGWLVWFLTRSRGQEDAAPKMTHTQGNLSPVQVQAKDRTLPVYTIGVKPAVIGDWEIYVKGQHYQTLADITDAQTREEVTNALRALAGFAKGAVKKSQATVPPVEPTSHAVESRTQATRPTSPLSQRLAQPAQTTNPGTSGAVEAPTRRITPLRGSLPTIDFAYEINSILDELLTQTPALQGHTIVLQNIPGGINFFVDGTVYKEITDIPDEEIQALIRHATQEWERR